MITVRCDRCDRTGRYHTAKLVAKYGNTDIQQFQRDITADCPRNSARIELGNLRSAAPFRAIVPIGGQATDSPSNNTQRTLTTFMLTLRLLRNAEQNAPFCSPD
jgi:hypothetical protein